MAAIKKLLITGITGFIGSNCASYFRDKGHEVLGIDICGEAQSGFIQGEVNLENLKLFNENFDVIIHLAGSGTVGLAQQCPEVEHVKTVGSTLHILEYIKNFNKNAKLIYASSAAVYGDLHSEPISENARLNPISIYGQHKVESENLCQKYHNEEGLNINIIRFFSIYGEGLKKQLLWDFCSRVTKNHDTKLIPCFGTGKEKRDFIHISDALLLIDLLIDANQEFEILNCGSGRQISVNEILRMLVRELDFSGGIIYDNVVKVGDPKILVANVEKTCDLGFCPQVKLEDGIKQYVRWFRQNN